MSAPVSSQVLAAAATGFEQHLALSGGDPDSVLGNVGLTPDDIALPTNTLSLPAYCRMLELASESSRDPDFGLNYARNFEPEMLGLIGFVALTSPTVEAALSNFISLFPLHQNGTMTRISRQDDLVRMEYRIMDSTIARRRHDAEFTIGVFANVARRCLGNNHDIVRVEFEHAQPETLTQHHGFYDADVFFSQRTNALTLRTSRLDMPMSTKNLQLLDVLCGSLRSVACPPVEYDLVSRARIEVRNRLAGGGIKLPQIASALGIATWSFQRRLAEEGLTFSDLVDSVRRSAAEDLVRQRHIQLSEVAFLLGYSELSAFSRAFRGWHGISAQQYRKLGLTS